MKKAPCVNADQSQTQEATTNHQHTEWGIFIIPRSTEKDKGMNNMSTRTVADAVNELDLLETRSAGKGFKNSGGLIFRRDQGAKGLRFPGLTRLRLYPLPDSCGFFWIIMLHCHRSSHYKEYAFGG